MRPRGFAVCGNDCGRSKAPPLRSPYAVKCPRNVPAIQAGQGQKVTAAHQQITAGKPIPAVAVPCPAHEQQHRRAGQQVGQRPGRRQSQLLRRGHRQAAQPQADTEGGNFQLRPVPPQSAVGQRVAALVQNRAPQPHPQYAAAVTGQQQCQPQQGEQRRTLAQHRAARTHSAAPVPGRTAGPCAVSQNASAGRWRCRFRPPCPESAPP